MNTDLIGSKPIIHSLQKIRGISFIFANAVCRTASVDPSQKAGLLLDAEVKKIEEIIQHPQKFMIPNWMLNRRRDPATGQDLHLVTGDLQFTHENDLKGMKKIKSYRGVRHMFNLPCRGQRTKSNFRKNKTKGKGSLGVKRRLDAKKGRS
jgi:small subunit ribosomal protein S13